MKPVLFLICFTLLYNATAATSQEGVLAFSEFQIKSDGIGTSGPITVSGKKTDEGKFSQLYVEAFGKVIHIPEETLNKIPHKRHNGIQLTFEKNYKNPAEKTIYLQLQVGFTNAINERFILMIKDNGEVDILSKQIILD